MDSEGLLSVLLSLVPLGSRPLASSALLSSRSSPDASSANLSECVKTSNESPVSMFALARGVKTSNSTPVSPLAATPNPKTLHSCSSTSSLNSIGSSGSKISSHGGIQHRRRSAGAAAKLALHEKRTVANLLLIGGYAYRVLHCAKGSPSEQLGLVPWFDFIIKGGSEDFVKANPEQEDNSFFRVVGGAENQALRLKVYNCKNRSVRNLIIKPRRWVARGIVANDVDDVSSTMGLNAGLTGLKVVFDTYTTGVHVVRVLNVLASSPADHAGLQEMTDYLLGTTGGVAFKSSNAFLSCVNESVDKTLEMFVYSSVADTIRMVAISPNESWKTRENENDGKLGCDIGIGSMHALPEDSRGSLGTFRAQILLSNGSSKCLDQDPMNQSALENNGGGAKFAIPTVRPASSRPVRHQIKTDLGYGQALGECAEDGMLVVELDWKLPNGCVAVMFAQKGNHQYLPQLH